MSSQLTLIMVSFYDCMGACCDDKEAFGIEPGDMEGGTDEVEDPEAPCVGDILNPPEPCRDTPGEPGDGESEPEPLGGTALFPPDEECPEGMVRDSITGECVEEEELEPPGPQPIVPEDDDEDDEDPDLNPDEYCGVGLVMSETGKCVEGCWDEDGILIDCDPPNPTCTIDPDTGLCVFVDPDCGDGMEVDPETGNCEVVEEPDPLEGGCDPGMVWDEDLLDCIPEQTDPVVPEDDDENDEDDLETDPAPPDPFWPGNPLFANPCPPGTGQFNQETQEWDCDYRPPVTPPPSPVPEVCLGGMVRDPFTDLCECPIGMDWSFMEDKCVELEPPRTCTPPLESVWDPSINDFTCKPPVVDVPEPGDDGSSPEPVGGNPLLNNPCLPPETGVFNPDIQEWVCGGDDPTAPTTVTPPLEECFGGMVRDPFTDLCECPVGMSLVEGKCVEPEPLRACTPPLESVFDPSINDFTCKPPVVDVPEPVVVVVDPAIPAGAIDGCAGIKDPDGQICCADGEGRNWLFQLTGGSFIFDKNNVFDAQVGEYVNRAVFCNQLNPLPPPCPPGQVRATPRGNCVEGPALSEQRCPPSGVDPDRELFFYINDFRRLNGLHELVWDDRLHGKAAGIAELMHEDGFPSHNHDGVVDSGGYPGNFVLANVHGYNYNEGVYDTTPCEAVKKWVESSAHRNWMLSPQSHDGGTAIVGGQAVLVFGAVREGTSLAYYYSSANTGAITGPFEFDIEGNYVPHTSGPYRCPDTNPCVS